MEGYSVLLVLALVACTASQVHHRLPGYTRTRLSPEILQSHFLGENGVDVTECDTDVTHGTCHCECDDGWDGIPPNCNKGPCQPNPCLNGGSCSVIIGGLDYSCECPPGYIGKDCEYEEECRLEGGPKIRMNYNSGTWLNVFVDFEFECSGRVVQWEFHAKKRGTVFLAVWRPVEHGWQLIGKNGIRVRRRGQHVVFIPEEDQIQVKKGDVFGIQYPADMVTPEDDRGIISYTDNNKWGPGLCCGITEDMLSRIHNVAIQDEDLPIGVVRDGLRDFKRAVALHARVHNPAAQCSVEGGPLILLNYDSGVWLNIFVDRAFECSGPVTKWRFHAKKTGTVYLTVWRPDGNKGQENEGWTLIGKNRVHVSHLGVQNAVVPEDLQIEAEAGDVIGMQYPDEAFVPGDDRGIISYSDTRIDGPGLCCGLTPVDLSRIHNVAVPDEELPIGVHRSGLRDFSRAVALHAFINDNENLGPKHFKSKKTDKKTENLVSLLKESK